MTDEEMEKHPDYIAMKERYQIFYAKIVGGIFLISTLVLLILPLFLK